MSVYRSVNVLHIYCIAEFDVNSKFDFKLFYSSDLYANCLYSLINYYELDVIAQINNTLTESMNITIESSTRRVASLFFSLQY